jgi:hypothetical protein
VRAGLKVQVEMRGRLLKRRKRFPEGSIPSGTGDPAQSDISASHRLGMCGPAYIELISGCICVALDGSSMPSSKDSGQKADIEGHEQKHENSIKDKPGNNPSTDEEELNPESNGGPCTLTKPFSLISSYHK